MIQSVATGFILLLLLLAMDLHAQDSVSGTVIDSATRRPLPNVSIRVKNTSVGTSTNAYGYFSVKCFKQDTIIVSAIGYITQAVSADSLTGNAFIYLKQSKTLLREITVYPSIELQGLPRIPAESPWRNPTYTKEYMNTPGVPNIQTFGPSMIVKGPISRFSKTERERRKLKKLKEENIQAGQYVLILSDSSLRRNLQETYNLKDDEFPTLIEDFNRQYPDAYLMEKDEIISSFMLFLSQRAKKQ